MANGTVTRLGLLGIAIGVIPAFTGAAVVVEANDTSSAVGTVSNYGTINGTAAVTESRDVVNNSTRYTSVEYITAQYVLDDIVGFVGQPEVSEGRVTSLSNFGTPRTPPEQTSGAPETRIREGRDTATASGNVVITGVSADVEANDIVAAIGTAFGGSTYSNAWFNQYWFNDAWFNSSWFNTSTDGPNGTSAATDQADTTAAAGKVLIDGTSSLVEQDDTVSAVGTSGGDVAGAGVVLEADDDVSAFGRVWIIGTAALLEDRDVVTADGSLPKIGVLLSWEEVGNVVSVSIYRSTDNINFTEIAIVSPKQLTYTDSVSDGTDYYYYLVGNLTTGETTDQSATALLDLV